MRNVRNDSHRLCLMSSLSSYVQSWQTDAHWPLQNHALPAKKRSTGGAQREAFGLDSEKSRKKEALQAEVEFLFTFQISYKDERMSNPNWPPSPSKWHSEHYQRGGGRRPRFNLGPQRGCKPFSAILLFPLQRTVSRVPRRQWVERGIFFGTNSAAVHLLIEPGSQREAQYRTLSSPSTWAINTPKQEKRGLMKQQQGTHVFSSKDSSFSYTNDHCYFWLMPWE